MGKKKSVVLMTLLTIVIVALCILTAFPKFAVPGTVKNWTPAILQYDLGRDLGGGYYTYYYPEGVISEADYENNLAEKETEDDKNDYIASYKKHGGLYLETDPKKNIVTENDTIEESFKKAVEDASKEVSARFSKMGYSDFRVAIVDDYAIRVELPRSDAFVGQAMSSFAMTGEMTITKGEETIDELKGKDDKITDLIKGFSVGTRYKVSYLDINFTKEGKEMLKGVKETLTARADASESATTLNIKIGDDIVASIYKDDVSHDNKVKVPLADQENASQVKIIKVLCESVLECGEFDISFQTFESSDVRYFEPAYGKNVLNATYIALGVIILAICVLSVLKMGRFGIVNVYSVLSYLIVTGLCYAFITKAAFEITFGSILVFLIGLIVISLVNFYIYGSIKKHVEEGKTVVSAVKSGYNKTLGLVVDIYAVALLATVALLVCNAGLFTLSLQAIICIVTGAFISLLWGRAINFTFLSASKDKYKYFRFVREEDEDDE